MALLGRNGAARRTTPRCAQTSRCGTSAEVSKMALKGKINKAERDALSDVLKAEYKPLIKDGNPVKDAAGNELFILDTPDMEHRDDITGLKSALEDERSQNTRGLPPSKRSVARSRANLKSRRGNTRPSRQPKKP
jgi:hypothetical protein